MRTYFSDRNGMLSVLPPAETCPTSDREMLLFVSGLCLAVGVVLLVAWWS